LCMRKQDAPAARRISQVHQRRLTWRRATSPSET
jgi:hypothetical protein